MEQVNVILSGILFFATLAIIALAYYSFRRREVPGAYPFVILCLVSTFYTFGYGMELLAQNIGQVDLWSKFQYIGLPFIPALWVILSNSLTRKEVKNPPAFYFFLFLVPVLTGSFRLISSQFHLQYGAMSLISNGYFQVLEFEKGPWYYVHLIYFMVCAGYATLNYWKVYLKTNGYLKRQSLLMIIASLLPVGTIMMNISGLFPLKLDGGPFIGIFNYLLFTYGIFRYQLLYLIPLSRDKVFDWISDGVIVLDLHGRIADFNKTAGLIFARLSKNTTGLPMEECLSTYEGFIRPLSQWQAEILSRETKQTPDPIEGSNYEFEIYNDVNQKMNYYQVRVSALYEYDVLIGATALITDITQQHEMLQQLEHNARTDDLTGLMNRRYFLERMEYEMHRVIRAGGGFALMIIDIDYFKRINDTWGHLAGDYVLKVLSDIIVRDLRTIDLVGRFGGEEFIIFLPNTGLENAGLIADRIRKKFETAQIIWYDNLIRLSASFGVTAFTSEMGHPLEDYDSLFKKADNALYLAKKNGRNRVEAV